MFTSDTFTYTAEDEDGTMVELTFTIVVTAAAIPLALSWLVPTSPVGNIFSVTLNSNHPLGGVELDDFRLRIQDNSDPVVALTATNTNISAVSGTNNWRLDITLTETLDAEYTMRLRRETVQYDGVDYPAVFLVSDTFSIDSSIGADAVPDAPTGLTPTEAATSIAWVWTAGADNGAAISDYEFRYAQGTSIPANTAWVSTGSITPAHTITGLSKGTEYAAEVRAVNSEGAGSASTLETATTLTTVYGTPTGLSVIASTTTTLTISWIDSIDTGGTPVTGHRYRIDGGNWVNTGSITTTHIITGFKS